MARGTDRSSHSGGRVEYVPDYCNECAAGGPPTPASAAAISARASSCATAAVAAASLAAALRIARTGAAAGPVAAFTDWQLRCKRRTLVPCVCAQGCCQSFAAAWATRAIRSGNRTVRVGFAAAVTAPVSASAIAAASASSRATAASTRMPVQELLEGDAVPDSDAHAGITGTDITTDTGTGIGSSAGLNDRPKTCKPPASASRFQTRRFDYAVAKATVNLNSGSKRASRTSCHSGLAISEAPLAVQQLQVKDRDGATACGGRGRSGRDLRKAAKRRAGAGRRTLRSPQPGLSKKFDSEAVTP